MTDYEIIKWLLIGYVLGGLVVHLFWSLHFKGTLTRLNDFAYFVRKGYNVDAAWKLSK